MNSCQALTWQDKISLNYGVKHTAGHLFYFLINDKQLLFYMTLFKHIRAVFLLPFNVLIIIPTLLFVFADNKLIFSDLPLFIDIMRYILSILFFLLGLFLVIANIITFHKIGKGTLAPWDPPQNLVVVGMYRYVRNPMVTGIMFILTSEAMFLFTVVQLIWTLFFVSGALLIIPLYEEKRLIKRFGEDYLHYKENVPRWIPSKKPYNPVK